MGVRSTLSLNDARVFHLTIVKGKNKIKKLNKKYYGKS